MTQLYKCSMCKTDVPSSELKVKPDQNGYVCVKCYDAHIKRESKPSKPLKEEVGASGETSERIKHVCNDCNYQFSANRNSIAAKKCGYCGSNNVTIYENFDVNRLLEEADE